MRFSCVCADRLPRVEAKIELGRILAALLPSRHCKLMLLIIACRPN